MKKYCIIILAVLSVIQFTACEDALDKEPLDKFSGDNVWSDNSLATGFMLDTYDRVIRKLYSNQFTDDWTDNIIGNPDNGSGRTIQSGSFENTLDAGWNKFDYIRRCNLAIEKLSNNTAIDPEISTLLLAEAKMLRAMTYGWQARRFGGLIIVDKVLSPTDDLKMARSTERETYDFIYKDIEDAIVGLPVPSDAQRGRLHKAAAYAFMAQFALQVGDYQKVIDAVEKVEEYDFVLDTEYKNLFNSYSGTINSKEVIFLMDRGEENNIFVNTRMFRSLMNASNGQKLKEDAVPQYHKDDDFASWPLRWPSQELVDSYLFIEGGEAIDKKAKEFQGQPSKLLWMNRDARFEQSIVRDSAVYSKSVLTFRKGGNSHWTSNPLSTWGMSKSGYMFRKWMYEDMYFFYNYKLDWAEPIMRLGEVYLNKAEAYGRLGNIPKAVEYMNKTRTIHGKLPALSTGSSESDFWKFYKIERRVELAMEDDRYWSLVRWARAENVTSVPELDGYKLNCINMEFDGLVNIEPSPFTVDMKFELPKRLFFPVPDREIRENDKLTQNPGWN